MNPKNATDTSTAFRSSHLRSSSRTGLFTSRSMTGVGVDMRGLGVGGRLETPRNLMSANLRPGEKRLRVPASPSAFKQPRNLTNLFLQDITDSSASGDFTGQTENADTFPRSATMSSTSKHSVHPPARAFSTHMSVTSNIDRSMVTPLRNGSVSRSSFAGYGTRMVDEHGVSGKKRKIEQRFEHSLSDDSLNTSVHTVQVQPKSKLEAENHRLRFECESATKLLQTERILVEERLRKQKAQDDETAAKTKEMWSEAEKILAENTRVKTKLDKAEEDSIAVRKRYEDQIVAIKTDHLNKDRQQDKDLRECRAENLSLNERIKGITREWEKLAAEKKIWEKQQTEYQRMVQKAQTSESELHTTKMALRAKDAQYSDLLATNSLLSNMSEEMKQYRELQVSVPILRKENERLREKAALARANEGKIQTLQDTIARYEERQSHVFDLELENERLKDQIADWNPPEEAAEVSPRRIPERLQRALDEVGKLRGERQELKDEDELKNRKIEELTAAKNELTKRLDDAKTAADAAQSVRSRLEQELREKGNALIATEKERDTFKLIKDTMDSTHAGRRSDSVVYQKIRELEERATRSQTLAADFEHRYEQIKLETGEVREELQQVQDRYNAEVTSNQRIVLNLNEELDALRKIRADESAAQLEVYAGGVGMASVRAITLVNSPADLAQKRYLEEAKRVLDENRLLQEKLNQIRSSGSGSTDLTMNAEEFLKGPGEQLEDLKRQLEKAKTQLDLNMKSFQKTSSTFRQICKVLLGWHIRFDSNKVVFRVADASPSDTITFEREDENSAWELKPSDYATANAQFVTEFLQNHHSPPGFFARIILQILSERTMICLATSPGITP